MNTKVIPNLSVDCVVFGFDGDTLKVLLIRQKQIDNTINPLYALPGNLVKYNEELDGAADRVLKQLTDLEGIYLKQFQAFGNPNRVNAEKDRAWLESMRQYPDERVITIAYYSLVNIDDFEPHAREFADETEWVPLLEIPPLAFDHSHILDVALETLREQLYTKQIGFELLPEKFTLSQLQRLYESILNKKLDKRNFRKSVKKINNLIALDEKEQGVDHKPAQLYQYVSEVE